MAEPSRYRKVYRSLSRVVALTNFFGALFVMSYFALIGDESQPATQGVAWQPILVVGVAMAALILLGNYVSDLYLKPTLHWYRAACEGADPGPAPERVRWMALRIPLVSALTTWGAWGLGGLFFGLIGSWDAAAGAFKWEQFWAVELGSLVAGTLTMILLYMGVENIWRHELPLFFTGQELAHAGGKQISVRARMMFVSAISTGLMIFLVYISYTRASAMATADQPGSLLLKLLGLQVLMVVSGVMVLLQLRRNMDATVIGPLERLSAHVQRIGQGELNLQAEVESNDEIGVLAGSLNQMAANLQLREAELQAINQIGREIVANLELDPTLQTILVQVRSIIPCDVAEICLVREEVDQLEPRARAGESQDNLEAPGERLGEGWTGQVAQQRRTLRSHSGQAGLPAAAPQMGGLEWASYLGVPLLARERLVGTLALGSRQAASFDAHEQAVLEAIAPQAAIAIANAAEVLARESSLKAQIARLEIEIDEVRRSQQISEITDSEFFQNLQSRAEELRARRRRR